MSRYLQKDINIAKKFYTHACRFRQTQGAIFFREIRISVVHVLVVCKDIQICVFEMAPGITEWFPGNDPKMREIYKYFILKKNTL